MRSILLASSLFTAPALAAGAPQCAIPAAVAAPPSTEAQPVGPVAMPVPATAPLPRQISVDQVDRVPALRRIASNGAQLFDLGTEHGLRTVFARNGSVFQVFYVTADGQAAVGGVMWTADGQNVTKHQVAPIEGTLDALLLSLKGGLAGPGPVPVADLVQAAILSLEDVAADASAPLPAPAAGPGGPNEDEEDTLYTPMLESVAKAAATTQPLPEVPHGAPAPGFTREVAAIEAAMGSSPAEARVKADQAAATLETRLVKDGLPELPPLSPAEFLQEVEALTVLVEGIARRPAPNAFAAE